MHARHCLKKLLYTHTRVQVIADPPCIMTASSDRSVRLWSLCGAAQHYRGDRISTLTLGRDKDARRTDTYRFPLDSGERHRARLLQAAEVLGTINKLTAQVYFVLLIQ
jgi:hypothetical protein